MATISGSRGPYSQRLISGGVGPSRPRPPFDPRDLSGLVLWLRADAGITLNGSNVSLWSDQSGQVGNSVGQGNSSRQPAYQATGGPNSLPALSFASASNNCLVSTSAPLGGATTMTAFALIKCTSTATAMRAWSVGNNRAGNFNGFALTIAGDAANHRDHELVGTAFDVDTTNNATTNWELIMTQSASGPTHSMRVNGSAHTLSPSNSAVVAPAANVGIGVADIITTTSFFNGQMAEYALYTPPLSAAGVSAFEAYVSNRTAVF